MSILTFAGTTPDKPAIIAAETGDAVDFATLNSTSMRLARVLRNSLDEGARVAMLMENVAAAYTAAWACRRAGLRCVPVNWHLSRDEAAYIVSNSDARALIVSPGLAALACDLAGLVPNLTMLLVAGEAFDRFASLD
ncbi:MAG: AMP-binding protein [Rudaea sp.]|nr:AMP-binding protein [Rudaea sp.]